MVRDLERVRQTVQFPQTAPAANPVFYRTYSRRISGRRETWEEVCDRTLRGLIELGFLTPSEAAIIEKMQHELKSLPSGRWLWVGGTDWIDLPENYSGAYNCTSTNVVDWRAFGLMMDLAMMGCGTGALLEPQYINSLPPIRNHLNVIVVGEIGTTKASKRQEQTSINIEGNTVKIRVGDSRRGWVKSYQTLLELSTDERFSKEVTVQIDLGDVRPVGEKLKGFGGVANPVKLPELYTRCATILNKAVGRQLNSVECCLLIDEAAVVVVAGNVRRCIAYGTRVCAAHGMLPIQDIQVGDLVLTSSGEYRPVLNKFIQGVQDVLEIRTTAASIRCTANHRVAVYDGLRSYKWKRSCELQKGDRLICVPHTKGLPCSTTDYAWLVGFFLGDGHADIQSTKRNGGGGSVSFAISTNRLHGGLGQKILRILTSLGHNPAVHIQETYAHILIYRKELALELGQYKQAWGTPVIPEFVWRGSREIRAAFLAGLSDADGTPSRNVLLNSNKLEFLRDVQRLALSLGIATRVHERSSKTLVGRDLVYEGCHWLHIRGLQSQALAVALINQFAVHDGFRLKTGKKNGLSLPYQFVQEAAVAGWRPSVKKFPSDLIHPSKNNQKYRDANWDALIVEDAVNPHWLPMEVQFIAPAGQAETFDIEVEGNHEFIADGLLVHNSAGMRQSTSEDELFAQAKSNLWQQDENGNWRIDPQRDALRMANHTRVFHHKPSLEECIEAVRTQYYSGEGAIQWAGEAIARANADILNSSELKEEFILTYATSKEKARFWVQNNFPKISNEEIEHRLSRYGLNPCGEIIGANFHCNLSEIHLNQIDPKNYKEQEEAFRAGALSVASLLNHKFGEERYQKSRELDPIVGVSFTGLFDFFVHALGVKWLQWWEAGRPETPEGRAFKQQEQEYLSRWKEIVQQVVWDYCDRHNIKRPNRCTTVQPSGTKSLLTGASPGWHPPKAQRFIRRITFRKNDPVALACIDYGYNVVPSQSDKDKNGNLLNDPFDSRCTEWLVEIPVAVPWADLPGADEIDISKFSALAQMDFYMQVQKFYVTHNTSATIELRENEVEALGERIYQTIQDDEGYISAALLARFDAHQSFPRLPFEPITKQLYEQLLIQVEKQRKTADFQAALNRYDLDELTEAGPSGCDSDKCIMPEQNPQSK